MNEFFSRGSIVGIDNPITDLLHEMVSRGARNMIIRVNTPTSYLVGGMENLHYNSTLLSLEEIQEDMLALGIDASIDDNFHLLYKADDLPGVHRLQFIIACIGPRRFPSMTVRYVSKLDENELPTGVTL